MSSAGVPKFEHATNSGKEALPLLLQLCHSLFEYLTNVRRIMVKGCICTHLLYCSSTWYYQAVLRKNRKLLKSLQRKCAITISGSYRTITYILVQNLPPIDLEIFRRSILWLLTQRHPTLHERQFSSGPTHSGKFQL